MKDFSCYTSGAGSALSGGLWRFAMMAMAMVLAFGSGALGQGGQPAASLEQIRNGSATDPTNPAQWQNGNAGSQTAHYVESHSIGYRAILTNLPTNGTVVVLTLGYDVRHSSKNAIDFLTYFDRLQPHGQFEVGGQHPAQEIVDPTIGFPLYRTAGTPSTALAPTDQTLIPRPVVNSTDPQSAGVPGIVWDKLTSAEKQMSIWGANFTNIPNTNPAVEMRYVGAADLSEKQSEQRIQVAFIPVNSTAILSWGGHIADRRDWGVDNNGVPLSAGGISGSPYHMRLIDWNLNNLGNQDRSLAAAAVVPVVECEITGPAAVCGGTTNAYTGSADVNGATYEWSITGNGKIKDGAMLVTTKTIVAGATEGSTSVDVVAEATGSYTLSVTISAAGFQPQTCSKTVTINANPAAPTVSIVNPSCSSMTGTITVTSPLDDMSNDYQYSYNNGAYTESPGPFTFQAGAGYSIKVKNKTTGCESSATTCAPDPNYVAPTSGLTSGASLSAKAVNAEKAVEPVAEEMTAYPVPFSERATVEFRTTETEQYTLGLYDMKGALVKVLKSGTAVAGELQQVEVDGRALAEGIYIVRMTRDSGAESVKLLLKRK